MPAYTILPGVMQDFRGRFFRYGRYPGRTIRIEGGTVPIRPFSIRLAHVWEYASEGESRVHSCGKPRCTVCGENGLVAKHRIITQEQ